MLFRIVLSVVILIALLFSGLPILVYFENPLPDQKIWLAIAQILMVCLILFLASIPIISYLHARKRYIIIITIILIISLFSSLFMMAQVKIQIKNVDLQKLSQEIRLFEPDLAFGWTKGITKVTETKYSVNYEKFGRNIGIHQQKSSGQTECSTKYFLSLIGKGFYDNKDDFEDNCEKLAINGNIAVYTYFLKGYRGEKYKTHIMVWNQSGTRVHINATGIEKEELIQIANSFREK